MGMASSRHSMTTARQKHSPGGNFSWIVVGFINFHLMGERGSLSNNNLYELGGSNYLECTKTIAAERLSHP